MGTWANYGEWIEQCSDYLKRDPIWKFTAYPKSLWLFDLVWQDCEKLKNSFQGEHLVRQLIRSTDSVSANIDEGFGRGMERQEYTYYLRIALGSARETRSRYFKLRHALPSDVVEHRTQLCSEIIALLTSAINRRR
ncbi:MAG: four helix bundle protein [Anaerolineae bacterium]|nr:four helix bundle protein [Anaerolineae bacterium]